MKINLFIFKMSGQQRSEGRRHPISFPKGQTGWQKARHLILSPQQPAGGLESACLKRYLKDYVRLEDMGLVPIPLNVERNLRNRPSTMAGPLRIHTQ